MRDVTIPTAAALVTTLIVLPFTPAAGHIVVLFVLCAAMVCLSIWSLHIGVDTPDNWSTISEPDRTVVVTGEHPHLIDWATDPMFAEVTQ
jgi:hypothetical protein